MHTINELEDNVYTVGCWDPKGVWVSIEDFTEFRDAADMCSWLNGGLDPDLSRKLFDSLKIGGGLNK